MFQSFFGGFQGSEVGSLSFDSSSSLLVFGDEVLASEMHVKVLSVFGFVAVLEFPQRSFEVGDVDFKIGGFGLERLDGTVAGAGFGLGGSEGIIKAGNLRLEVCVGSKEGGVLTLKMVNLFLLSAYDFFQGPVVIDIRGNSG